jgi:hypothetical protein
MKLCKNRACDLISIDAGALLGRYFLDSIPAAPEAHPPILFKAIGWSPLAAKTYRDGPVRLSME